MGKIDDMRRLREAQQAGPGSASPRRTAPETAKPGGADGEIKGKCATCGKLRTLQNGLVSNHQKGLGKACPGSRKPPA